jgi:hypothetical protein
MPEKIETRKSNDSKLRMKFSRETGDKSSHEQLKGFIFMTHFPAVESNNQRLFI